jgi:hypothetical protein
MIWLTFVEGRFTQGNADKYRFLFCFVFSAVLGFELKASHLSRQALTLSLELLFQPWKRGSQMKKLKAAGLDP